MSADPFRETDLPFGIPDFANIKTDDYRPGFARALTEHRGEIDAIASNAGDPTFDNTIATLESSGAALRRIEAVFWNLVGTDADEALQAIEREMAPITARHYLEITTNTALFARIDRLFETRASLGLDPEELRVLERTHKNFVRAGAKLSSAGQKRLTEIIERLAVLSTLFSQNVLADVAEYKLVLEDEDDLAGLPESLRASAARNAQEKGHPGKHVVTLARSDYETFMQFSTRRDLREALFRAWTMRGESGGATDNRVIMSEIIALRDDRAKLLGYATFADYKLDDTMAKTPAHVRGLLDDVWQPARARANDERATLQTKANEEGANFDIAAHDWRFYSEKVRKETHNFDEAELKPYLQLDKIIAAAFYTATQLFGLQFNEVHGLALYHPDVRAFDVRDRDGKHVALFLGDYFARASKRGGAWMSGFRTQQKLEGDIRPIIVNVMNFAKPPEGRPALLSLDDARTLFHEFGHALHGMLSDVTYPLISGTSVAGDFVELPSQLYEHWLLRPEILGKFALHAESGEPMPAAFIERVLASCHFNQGFATVEYCASAMVDLDLHLQSKPGPLDVVGFERATLARIDMPEAITMRHRTPHFSHIFAGDGYAAGYYSYLWSEVLDADAFAAFEETGNVFDPELARRLYTHIYSAGGRQDAADAYIAFRGRMPTIEPLLTKRGLA
ncbi:MAG: M3 family metallopeptidase [Methylobacteriaceae bacterium]|nr:M3 family metallopeptidase [Methylobacteriaceae bacterium]